MQLYLQSDVGFPKTQYFYSAAEISADKFDFIFSGQSIHIYGN